jgi:hypothetical protein
MLRFTRFQLYGVKVCVFNFVFTVYLVGYLLFAF